jgi:hypothetical protein
MIAAMEGRVLEDLLREGDEAIVAADWERARACLEKVLARDEGLRCWRRRSRAAWPNASGWRRPRWRSRGALGM